MAAHPAGRAAAALLQPQGRTRQPRDGAVLRQRIMALEAQAAGDFTPSFLFFYFLFFSFHLATLLTVAQGLPQSFCRYNRNFLGHHLSERPLKHKLLKLPLSGIELSSWLYATGFARLACSFKLFSGQTNVKACSPDSCADVTKTLYRLSFLACCAFELSSLNLRPTLLLHCGQRNIFDQCSC